MYVSSSIYNRCKDNKLEKLTAEELFKEFEKINANEVIMPTLVPSKVFDDTERKELFGKEMFNLVDRNKKHYSLSNAFDEKGNFK